MPRGDLVVRRAAPRALAGTCPRTQPLRPQLQARERTDDVRRGCFRALFSSPEAVFVGPPVSPTRPSRRGRARAMARGSAGAWKRRLWTRRRERRANTARDRCRSRRRRWWPPEPRGARARGKAQPCAPSPAQGSPSCARNAYPRRAVAGVAGVAGVTGVAGVADEGVAGVASARDPGHPPAGTASGAPRRRGFAGRSAFPRLPSPTMREPTSGGAAGYAPLAPPAGAAWLTPRRSEDGDAKNKPPLAAVCGVAGVPGAAAAPKSATPAPGPGPAGDSADLAAAEACAAQARVASSTASTALRSAPRTYSVAADAAARARRREARAAAPPPARLRARGERSRGTQSEIEAPHVFAPRRVRPRAPARRRRRFRRGSRPRRATPKASSPPSRSRRVSPFPSPRSPPSPSPSPPFSRASSASSAATCARHELSVPPSGDANGLGAASATPRLNAHRSRRRASPRWRPRTPREARARRRRRRRGTRARRRPRARARGVLRRLRRASDFLFGKRGVPGALGAHSGDGGVIPLQVRVRRVRGSEQALLRHDFRGFVPGEHSPDAVARGFKLARAAFARQRVRVDHAALHRVLPEGVQASSAADVDGARADVRRLQPLQQRLLQLRLD